MAIALLLGFTKAELSQGKILRIDLEKHYVPHVEIEDLEESEEDDA